MSVVRLRYHTIEFGELDIHLRTLRDNQQFSDDEGEAEALGISSAFWPLFGIVWDSGNVLAHLMVEYEIVGLRILEVGCGIALASLVLNHRLADITATAQAVTAERKVSKIFGGSCQIPLAAFATVEGEQMRLRAMVATPDGARMASADVSGPASAPEQLGEQVAQLLRGQDAAGILASCAVTPDNHEGLAPHA